MKIDTDVLKAFR